MVLEHGGHQKVTILFYRKKTLQQKENHEIKIEPLTVKHLDVPDEYDTIYMCKLFEQYKREMVRVEYAGCGKSYACKEMENYGIKCYLFVQLIYWRRIIKNMA